MNHLLEEQKIQFQGMSQPLLNEQLEYSCRFGHLDVVSYLLTSPDLKEHADIHTQDDWPLKCASECGHLEVVKYLLTSPELKEHANIRSNSEDETEYETEALRYACCGNHFNIVKYLLTSPDLKEHANIHTMNDISLRISYSNHNLEMVRYLLASPDLNEHANIHTMNDSIFIDACDWDEEEFINFCIFECNIEKTLHIEEYLTGSKKHHILQLFMKRDLKNTLENNLPYYLNNTCYKNNKVKV